MLTKTHLLLLALFLAWSVLSACGAAVGDPGEGWTVYHAASDTLVNPSFPAYSFEYPSYWTGSDSETADISFVLAVDMGKEIRGRLSARMAAGGLEKWEEILFKMAGSLQVEK